MNSRDRILAAFAHEPGDRIPLDLGGTPVSAISKTAYDNLRAHLGMEPDTAPDFMSFSGQSVRPKEDLLEHFGIDTRSVQARPGKEWKLQLNRDDQFEFFHDEWGVGFRRPKDFNLYYDLYHNPLAGEEEDRTTAYPFPDPLDSTRIAGLRDRCQALSDAGRAVVFAHSFSYGQLHTLSYLMGWEDFFMKLLVEPDEMRMLLRRVLDAKLAFWDMVLGEMGGLIDVVYEPDDLGMQNGPLFNPVLYRELVKPYHKELFAAIKANAPQVKILLHSCGSVKTFIPDFIEIGVDALNPVQISADGMDPATIKREFGKDIVFWGGAIDCQNVLPNASPAEVKEQTKRNLSIFADHGGYVMNTIHNIQADVPPENIVALFEAAAELG